MELSRRTIQRMILRESGDTTVINQGSEGGGGGVTLGPLLASLNAVAMPTAEGYLHWTGSAWEFPSIDLSSYATKQWVQQQGYITSSAISDMATETWVLQQGFATTSQLSHYLALTGGTMEDSIITPGSDSYGIYPETDRYGFIGKSTNWYWNIYGSRLYAEKMELYVYSSGSRSLYGGIDNNNFYLYPGTNSYKFNVDSNGYVTAQKFVKDGGTSSQFLKADGTVDTNTYLTSVPSSYVSVDNDGIFSHQIITDNQVHLYGGNGHLYGSIVIGDNNNGVVDIISTNELGQLTWGSDSVVMSSDISDMATKTWVGHQGFSRGHNVYGGLTSGYPVVGDNDFIRWDMPFTFDPADGGTVIPAFLPLSDVGVQNGKVLRLVEFPNYDAIRENANYNQDYAGVDSDVWPDEAYFKGLVRWAIATYPGIYTSDGTQITLMGSARPNSSGTAIIELYSTRGYDSQTKLPRYCSGTFRMLSGQLVLFGTVNYTWYWNIITPSDLATRSWVTNSATAASATNAAKLGGVAAANYATQSWVNSQGHVASAGALKYSGTAKVSAQNDGALVDGYLHIGNVSVAEGGSFTYYPTITFGDYNGTDVYIQEDSEDHMSIRASAGITLLDATTINDSLHFSPTVSGYDCQVGMYLSSNLFNFVSINGQQSISGYNFDAEVRAPSFAISGAANVGSLVIHNAAYPNVSVSMSADFGNGYVYFTSGMRGYIFDAPVTQSSDIRMKDIVSKEKMTVEDIANIPLVKFTMKDDKEKKLRFGSIAQEWQKIIPETVIEDGEGMLTMDYGAAAMAAGVTACREVVALKKEIEELKEIINQLKK